MRVQELLDACLTMQGAYIGLPFGKEPICARVGRHNFAEVYPSKGWATFHCEAERGLEWRSLFPQDVRRGYYCPPSQQPYNVTAELDGGVPDDVLLLMARESYARALRKMTKAERAEITQG